jgi:hypothetical protein
VLEGAPATPPLSERATEDVDKSKRRRRKSKRDGVRRAVEAEARVRTRRSADDPIKENPLLASSVSGDSLTVVRSSNSGKKWQSKVDEIKKTGSTGLSKSDSAKSGKHDIAPKKLSKSDDNMHSSEDSEKQVVKSQSGKKWSAKLASNHKRTTSSSSGSELVSSGDFLELANPEALKSIFSFDMRNLDQTVAEFQDIMTKSNAMLADATKKILALDAHVDSTRQLAMAYQSRHS